MKETILMSREDLQEMMCGIVKNAVREVLDENATPNSNNMEDLTMQKTQELVNLQTQLLHLLQQVNKTIDENQQQLQFYNLKLNEVDKCARNFQKQYAQMTVTIQYSQESKNALCALFRDNARLFKEEIRQETTHQISRLRDETYTEYQKMDIIRLRWWPTGVIVLLVFTFMFCLIVYETCYMIEHW